MEDGDAPATNLSSHTVESGGVIDDLGALLSRVPSDLDELVIQGYLSPLVRLDFLENFPRLKTLRFWFGRTEASGTGGRRSASWTAADLENIGRLESLTTLSLPLRGDEDLQPLSQATRIRRLSLGSEVRVPNLAPLSTVESLESLELSSIRNWYDAGRTEDSASSALRDLEGKTSLRQLVLQINPWDDLSALKLFPNLHEVHLRGRDNTSESARATLAPLRGMAQLKVLSLHGFLFRTTDDYEPLGTLCNLEELEIDGGQYTDGTFYGYGGGSSLEHLGALQRLKTLTLRRLGVEDLSGIRRLPSLENLVLAEMRRLRDNLSGRYSTAGDSFGAADDSFGQPVDLGPEYPAYRTYWHRFALGGVSDLRTLTTVELVAMPQIRSLRPLRGLTNLRSLTLTQMRGLEDRAALEINGGWRVDRGQRGTEVWTR